MLAAIAAEEASFFFLQKKQKSKDVCLELILEKQTVKCKIIIPIQSCFEMALWTIRSGAL